MEIEQGTVIYQADNNTMTVISLTLSTIGLLLSGGALILLFLTAFLFAEWRQNYKNQLLIQFMISRFLYTFVRYIYDTKKVFSLCVNEGCVIYLDIVAMIYTELTLVCWMFIFTRHMYESLVKVFDIGTPRLWLISVLAWSIPGGVSLICHLIYKLQDNKDLFLFTFYLVILKWPLLIVNAVLLVLILKSILKSNLSKTENNKRIISVMIALIFLFCIQQVLLDSLKIIHVFLLNQWRLSSSILIICNILLFYHCAFSIIFWVFANANTRRLWKAYFNRTSEPSIDEEEKNNMTIK